MRFSQLKVGVIAALLSVSSFAAQEFLNVSYDPTRELYTDSINSLVLTGNSVPVKILSLNNHTVVLVNRPAL